eukprot:maker-scaffold_6-snap-gene-12.2-mRNA-1 protein AED:0.00 eAED:0.00 QI:251/1/1/1/1/1/2/81/66
MQRLKYYLELQPVLVASIGMGFAGIGFAWGLPKIRRANGLTTDQMDGGLWTLADKEHAERRKHSVA